VYIDSPAQSPATAAAAAAAAAADDDDDVSCIKFKSASSPSYLTGSIS